MCTKKNIAGATGPSIGNTPEKVSSHFPFMG